MTERIQHLREAERALKHALSLTASDHPTKGKQGLNDEWIGLVGLIVNVGLLADKLEQEAGDVEGADVLPDDPNLWHGSARSEQGLCTPSEVARVNALLNAGPDEPIDLAIGTIVTTAGNPSGRIENCTIVAVDPKAFCKTTIYTVRLPSGAERDYLAGDVFPQEATP